MATIQKNFLIALMLASMVQPTQAMNQQRIATLAGAVGAVVYGVLVVKNLWTYYPQIWDIEKKLVTSEGATPTLYNWKLQKYAPDRPIVKFGDKTFTDHNQGKDKACIWEWESVLKDLKTDFPEFAQESKRQAAAQQEQQERERKQDFEDALFLTKLRAHIGEEKDQIGKDLRTLNSITAHCRGWLSIRRMYKSYCKKLKLDTDQTQWSMQDYASMNEAMAHACSTGLCALMTATPLYKRAATLYWDLLKRYYRLIKIAHCVYWSMQKSGMPLVHHQLSEEQEKINDQIKKEDIDIVSWLQQKWRALFPNAA